MAIRPLHPLLSRLRPFLAPFLAAGALALMVFPAHAKKESPVLLEADRFAYDSANSRVMAIGNAEVVQDNYVLLADRISYDQKTGIVRAEGNVAVSESNGDVYFAEQAELKNEVKTGVIYNFRARFADDSLFAANEARKVSDSVTELDYAVYSPCKVCEDETGEGKKPFWQLQARHITIDEEEQKVSYRHAWFEFFEVPVFYTPYFSHATPGADRKSGFLTPSFATSGNLGTVVRLPYYLNIAQNIDAIITPINTTAEGPVLAGEMRHLLNNGYYELEGSITRPDRIDSTTGLPANGEELRWHVEGAGNFRLDDFWRAGFSGKRASDDTYLRRYQFGNEDLLTSKVYAGGFRDRSSLNMEMITFQGLRSTDDPDVIPLIHPLVDVAHESRAGWEGSRYGMTGNLMALSRDNGAQSRRLSSTAYWRLPGVSQAGHVFEVRPQMRADLYSVEDVATFTSGGLPTNYDGVVGRVAPELWFDWRYPLLRRFAASSLVIEPTVNVIFGVNGLNSNKIPNEDSLALEFSDTNLFSDDHYTGYDLIEEGTRVNYGIRGQWDYNYETGSNLEFLFGQNYHTDSDNLFPYSSDLTNPWSDIIGRLGWNVSNNLLVNYRFRLSQEELELQRNEIGARLVAGPMTVSTNYLRITNDPYLRNSDEIRGAGSFRLSRNWLLTGLARYDLSDDGPDGDGWINVGSGLVYQNECITVNSSVIRSYIRDRDVEPETAFRMEVFLKNLN